MSTASSGPDPASQPDPDQAPISAPAPQRFAGLLRRVFNYGKELLVAVRLRAACPEFPRLLAKPFGTADLRLILARISAAMGRALWLEDRFLRQGGLGRHAFLPPLRNPSPRRPRAARPDAARDQTPAPAQPARRTGNPLVPTVAQLTAELRRRPVGVVLAGICRDLGITSHHPLWGEVSHAIVACGGRLTELAQDADTRWCSKRWLEIPGPAGLDPGLPVAQMVAATGAARSCRYRPARGGVIRTGVTKHTQQEPSSARKLGSMQLGSPLARG